MHSLCKRDRVLFYIQLLSFMTNKMIIIIIIIVLYAVIFSGYEAPAPAGGRPESLLRKSRIISLLPLGARTTGPSKMIETITIIARLCKRWAAVCLMKVQTVTAWCWSLSGCHTVLTLVAKSSLVLLTWL
jgi:hypothetical protein